MPPPSQPFTPPHPGLIFDMLQGYQRSTALKAAVDLDLFTAIGDGPGDVDSLARHCSASPRGIRILCDFLTINGVLAKQDGKYSHTPTSAIFLDPRSPASMASVAKFLTTPDLLATHSHLAEIIRQGRTTLPGQGSIEPDNPLWIEFAESMAPLAAAIAPSLAEAVLDGHPGPMRVLDIAAGHGLFGIEIARQNPQAQITAQDWASVLRVATRNAADAGIADRYSLLPGSAFDVNFGGPYNAILLTNFLHHFDRAECITIMKKVHAALAPGGRAAILEFVPDEDRVSPPIPASFAMTMLASTVSGDAYTLSELTEMCIAAGFHDVTGTPIPLAPSTIVMAVA